MHTCSRAWHSEDQDHRRGTAGAERMRRSDWNDKKCFGNHTGHDDDEWRSVTRQSGSVKAGRTGRDQYQSDGDKTEWKALITLAESLPVDVRFIELMPIGYGKENTGVSNLELLDEIRKVYPDIRKDSKIHGNGPAVYYQIPGFTGGIGFISAMHGKFCKNCNRIRLTSTGDLKPCLCYGDTYPLKDLLRNGTEEEIRKQIKRAIEQKPAAHCFEEPGAITEAHQMAQIGG